MDDGTIDANTITVGQNLSTNRTITGTLNILGGEVTVGTLTLAEEPNSGNAIGIVNLSGGSLRATTITEAGGSRSFNFTGGTLSADTVEFGFTQAGGELSPGQSIGATEIVGGYTLDDGQILLEINGLDRGDFTLNDGIGYDTVTVDGTATLSSTIKLKSIDGFQLQQGTTLDLLAADTISITPGFDLDISEFDIDPLVLAMGQTGFNIVTENGLQILRLGIGVPEPSSMSLAGLGCLAVVGQARRRKRHARRN